MNAGSLHNPAIDELSPVAKDRLQELKLDDLDCLYSFRVNSTCRLWCIKYENIFSILWWDKKHKVNPVAKKHT